MSVEVASGVSRDVFAFNEQRNVVVRQDSGSERNSGGERFFLRGLVAERREVSVIVFVDYFICNYCRSLT